MQADACGPSYRYDALTRIVLESKEDMRRRGALSPDEWDAVALTFARPVAPSNFNRQDRLSAERAGVMVNVADNSRIGIVLHFRAW